MATGPHISKQCFLLFFSVWSLLLLFYKTLLQLVSVVSVQLQLNSCFSFSQWLSSNKMICLISLCWILVSSSWYFAWLGLFFLCYFYICLFPVLIALMVLSTVLPPCSLMLFQHGNYSTTVNSIHFPLHPSCLLFLPVTLSIFGFRCQLYCENFAKSKNGINIWDMTIESEPKQATNFIFSASEIPRQSILLEKWERNFQKHTTSLSN